MTDEGYIRGEIRVPRRAQMDRSAIRPILKGGSLTDTSESEGTRDPIITGPFDAPSREIPARDLAADRIDSDPSPDAERPTRTASDSITSAVTMLRDVDMPPDEVRAILAADHPAVVHRYVELHRERLEERLAEQRRTLARLERIVSREILDHGRRRSGLRTARGA